MLNYCDFIGVFVFTTNHHLNIINVDSTCVPSGPMYLHDHNSFSVKL